MTEGEREERLQAILDLRAEGKTWAEVGAEVGLHPKYAAAIVRRDHRARKIEALRTQQNDDPSARQTK